MIDVKFFARLRDALGADSIRLEPHAIATAQDVRAALLAQHPHWAPVLGEPSLMVAVNQTMARLDSRVKDGDEVAFFPPVTGG